MQTRNCRWWNLEKNTKCWSDWEGQAASVEGMHRKCFTPEEESQPKMPIDIAWPAGLYYHFAFYLKMCTWPEWERSCSGPSPVSPTVWSKNADAIHQPGAAQVLTLRSWFMPDYQNSFDGSKSSQRNTHAEIKIIQMTINLQLSTLKISETQNVKFFQSSSLLSIVIMS